MSGKKVLMLFVVLLVAVTVFIAGTMYLQNYGPKVRRGVDFTTVPKGENFTIEAQSPVMMNAGNCGEDFVVICDGRALETHEEERPTGTDCPEPYFVIKPVEVGPGKCEIFAREGSNPEFDFTSTETIVITSPYDQDELVIANAFYLIVVAIVAAFTLLEVWD